MMENSDLSLQFVRKSPTMPTLHSHTTPSVKLIPSSQSEPILRGLAAGVALERKLGIFFERAGGSSSLRVVTFNIMCTALGTGILALPYVFVEVGFVGGVLLLLLVWLITERSASFIGKAADLTGQELYTQISASAFGPAVGQVTGVILILFCFGASVGACVVIKQLFPPVLRFVFGNWPISEHPHTLMVLGALLILLPLSTLTKMEKLKFTSMASVALQFVIVWCVVLASVKAGAHEGSSMAVTGESVILATLQPELKMLSLQPLPWMRSVPIVAFAFNFHQNLPFLLSELRQFPPESKWPTKRDKLQVAVRVAGGICFVLYVTISIAATHAFGASVDKNVLISLASPSGLKLLPAGWVVMVMGSMSLVMICAFPLSAFGVRVGVHELCFGGGVESAQQRWAAASTIVAVCVFVAAQVDDLGALFRLIGATTGVYLMFLLPGALLVQLATQPTLPISSRQPYAPPSSNAKKQAGLPVSQQTQESLGKKTTPSQLPAINVPAAIAVVCIGVCISICGIMAVFFG